MKKIIFIMLLSTLPYTGNAAINTGYAEKCAELIEQSKSPTANWTTSNQEAAMAGECIGVIKAIKSLSKNLIVKTPSSYRSKRYSCISGSIIELAELIVNSKAVSIVHVTDALCHTE
jgi:hypothetical protein